MTIAPTLLEQLKNSTEPVPKKLDAQAGACILSVHVVVYADFRSLPFSVRLAAAADPIPKVSFIDNEPEFRWALLQESMAFDKLHEGIKKFAEDGETLKSVLKQKLQA